MDALTQLAPSVAELLKQRAAALEAHPCDAEARYRGFIEAAERPAGIGRGLTPDSQFARNCYRFAGLCYQAALELLESDDPRRDVVRASARVCFLETMPEGGA